ncbi:hypothetical protein D1Z97_04105 [Riemerella anatipestifer]|uniref:hypothetical protein n=1 Tax=Riemerella anatipestifer TaxID=34085 RepID=UPI00129EA3DA|nr:hypothetical protein [Riemerella anatipestifer]MBT0550955.1 hypothetical protein [Riemerella anatipestifer]MBT0553108.1 hypothetical protein [Riemerella anatipestifer]MCE3023800.1 hypothetical protein [Riemerella anatipestifer]MCU7559549.1 hypothetical protein [Riemerella anatipestifer]MDY3448731.1 hypothetical protein [Riemerella anatipestifer]
MLFKRFEILLFFILCLKIFLTGITTTISSFCEFYKYETPKIYKIIKCDNVVDNLFSTYSGFDTGYGFFAPNVSSNFVILSKNESTGDFFSSSDLMNTSESKLRFLSLNEVFFKNFEKDSNRIRANKIILNKINSAFEKKYHSKFVTTVYLYEYPRLKSEQKDIKLIKIDEVK